MKERIEELMRREGLTSVKFAEILSVQPSNISHILSGRNNPSYDFILKLIERFPSVNIEWIMTGKGDIYKSNTDQDSKQVTDLINDQSHHFTSVNDIDFALNDSEIRPQLDTSKPPIEKSANHTQMNVEFADENPQMLCSAKKEQKQVKKIILFYTDNTFEVFNS